MGAAVGDGVGEGAGRVDVIEVIPFAVVLWDFKLIFAFDVISRVRRLHERVCRVLFIHTFEAIVRCRTRGADETHHAAGLCGIEALDAGLALC